MPKSASKDLWVNQLLDWFNIHQRSMPWRSNPKPYYVWVSEIMLQQTQVQTVIPYFENFIQKFPNVHTLASADRQEVLKAWEGLGYYSRARNLHDASKLVVEKNQGIVPHTYATLIQLPGIGPYCAAAIASIAFQEPIPVVDGNVLRVFTRFWGIYDDIKHNKTKNLIFEKLTPHIQNVDPSNFNQGIMELGALICTPKNPKCSECPIQKSCFAYKNKKTTSLPFKSATLPTPHHQISVGVIWKNNKFLIAKRKEDKMLGGLWEYPGGKQNENESIQETVIREVKEETGLEVEIINTLNPIKHTYTHFKITLHAFECIIIKGKEKPISSDEIKWISLSELNKYPFPTANKKLNKQLIQRQELAQKHVT